MYVNTLAVILLFRQGFRTMNYKENAASDSFESLLIPRVMKNQTLALFSITID